MIGNVTCNGNESSVLGCSYGTRSDEEVSQCDPNEVAAVTCQGSFCYISTYYVEHIHFLITDPSTDFAHCITGEVRFTDFTDNSEQDSRQGTIQICVNNAWGSVCSDNYFDHTDADTFCDELVGFTANGMVTKVYMAHYCCLFEYFRSIKTSECRYDRQL